MISASFSLNHSGKPRVFCSSNVAQGLATRLRHQIIRDQIILTLRSPWRSPNRQPSRPEVCTESLWMASELRNSCHIFGIYIYICIYIYDKYIHMYFWKSRIEFQIPYDKAGENLPAGESNSLHPALRTQASASPGVPILWVFPGTKT